MKRRPLLPTALFSPFLLLFPLAIPSASAARFEGPTTLTGDAPDHHFGASVAGAGDVDGDGYDDVLVGADEFGSGEAFLYLGTASGLSTTPAASWAAQSGDSNFGEAVAGGGDVNGDGYADIMVASPPDYAGSIGKVYLYFGSPSGPSATADMTWSGVDERDNFGFSLAFAGDVDNDGYDDIVIGSPSGTGGETHFDVYFGSASGPGATADMTWTGDPSIDDGLGQSVDGAGDVDGDGYDDIIVGSDGYDGYTGRAYIYAGSASGPSTTPTTTLDGEARLDQFGLHVAGAGDVNGDGYADVVVAAPYADTFEGRVYAYLGSASGLSTTPDVIWYGTGSADVASLGTSIAGAGDVDNDGYDDFIVGAFDDDAHTGTGSALLYLGAASGFPTAASETFTGEGPDDYFGSAVDGAGDVTGDGYDDLVIGALSYDTYTGRVYFYDGASGGTTSDDADGDGYGAGYGDCDDSDASVNPGASEVCDAGGVDEDCDGLIDDADSGATGATSWYLDADRDGYGGGAATVSCDAPRDSVATDGDCDDGDAAIHPGAAEVCDTSDADEDCDGLSDDDDAGVSGTSTFYDDADGDGFGSGAGTAACDAPSGMVSTGDDCDDADMAVNPGATEACDTSDVDEDCDGLADDDDTSATGQTTWYEDNDGDGYGNESSTTSCDPGAGQAPTAGDCDDGETAVYPGAPEIDCEDPTDYNCDGQVGDGDADGDGFAACTECDDGTAAVNPSATEVCNDLDDNCDGDIDSNAVDRAYWYADADGDGFGDPYSEVIACDAPESGYLNNDDDCDDADAGSNPDAYDVPEDGIDQDCTGEDGVVAEPIDEDTGEGKGEEGDGGCQCATGDGKGAGEGAGYLLGFLAVAVGMRRRRG